MGQGGFVSCAHRYYPLLSSRRASGIVPTNDSVRCTGRVRVGFVEEDAISFKSDYPCREDGCRPGPTTPMTPLAGQKFLNPVDYSISNRILSNELGNLEGIEAEVKGRRNLCTNQRQVWQPSRGVSHQELQ